MKKLFYFTLINGLFIYGCQSKVDFQKIEVWKEEIRQAEKDFAQMATSEGIHKAFTSFAAEDAILSRNNELIKGRSAIDAFYDGQNTIGLNWSPDFIDVANSGDLGYTYGQYTFTRTDSLGNTSESTGVFHTV